MRGKSKLWLALGVALAGAGVAIAFGVTRDQDDKQCASMDICIADLRAMAHAPGVYASSMNKNESEFVQHVSNMEGALPALMPLLADPDRAVAQMAAKALHAYQMPINAKYLPQVRAGLDRNLAWLPAVLGDIESDEAAREAVARFLVSKDAPGNQEAFAVARAGARAVPFIVEAARCDRGCGKSDISNLRSVLADMGPERAAAAPGLLAIAQDPTASEAKVANALSLLDALGRDASSTESALVRLKQRWPSRAFQIDNVLISMHSRRAGAIFAERLGDTPDVIQLRDLAELGPVARDAGPAVVALLSNPDPEIRIGAARALGFIGFVPAVDPLVALLDDTFDVRMAWTAAESLARLRDSREIPALDRIAHAHWYPAVRETASRASASLKSGTVFVGKGHEYAFPSEFFAYRDIGDGVAECASPAIARATQPRYRKLDAEHDAASLAKLAYPATMSSDGSVPPPPQEAGLDAQYEEIMAERMRRQASEPDVTPEVALRVDQGWLAGSNRGEFGGELIYIGDGGKKQFVTHANVESVHVLGKRTLLVEGVAHGFNNGTVQEITRAGGGTWQAIAFRILPGAPRESWLTDTGELLIRLEGAGTVLLSADGSFRMAPCRARSGGKSDGR